MKIFIGGKDISEVIESISWSGDTKQVARKLNFSIAKNAKDINFPKATINEGDMVIMRTDTGVSIFGGVIFDIETAASSSKNSYLAYDFMHYVNGSDIYKVFDYSPEDITKEICNELEVSCGELPVTGLSVYIPCLGKKGYEAIMMAWTYASKRNGKKYMPLMQNIDQLSIIEKGTESGVILNGDYNLTDASYKSTLQNLINKVIIADKKGNVIKTVQDAASQYKYGTMQKVITQEDGKDATTEASLMLKTTEQTAAINAISDHRAISGYSIIIQEPETGLYGKFYIESDTHTFTGTKAEMQLTIAFENLMDEIEIEKKNK